jgi:hypothetical protein
MSDEMSGATDSGVGLGRGVGVGIGIGVGLGLGLGRLCAADYASWFSASLSF